MLENNEKSEDVDIVSEVKNILCHDTFVCMDEEFTILTDSKGVNVPQYPEYFSLACCDCGLVHTTTLEPMEEEGQKFIRMNMVRDGQMTQARREQLWRESDGRIQRPGWKRCISILVEPDNKITSQIETDEPTLFDELDHPPSP